MPRCIVLHDDGVENISAGDFSKPGADKNCRYSCNYKCNFGEIAQSTDLREASGILKPPCPYGNKNMIITFKADKLYIPGVKGILSLKSTICGNEVYETGGRSYVANRDNFLIINEGEAYSTSIDSEEQVESFCVFFGNDATKKVFAAHSLPLEMALNEDYCWSADNLWFDKRLQMGNDIISNILGRIERKIDNIAVPDHEYMEEQILLLLKTIFVSQKGQADNIDDLMFISAPRRIEIMKRLLIGKEFIDSYYREKINISQVAGVAKLSKYQFIRLFKKVYNVTPGRYLMDNRLESARKLLAGTNKNITEIALESGFSDPSYFSRLFKKVYSISPNDFKLSI